MTEDSPNCKLSSILKICALNARKIKFLDHDNLPGTFRNDEKTKKSSNCQKSPAHRSPHRKSVSFVDPFDDFENADVSLIPNNNASIPLDTKGYEFSFRILDV